MATTIVKTIGSDVGDDHATIQLWDDDAPASLLATDEVWEGRMRDEEHTGAGTSGGAAQVMDGTTTDATRFKRLTANSASGTDFKSFIDFKDDAGFKLRYGSGGAGGASVRWQSGVSAAIGLNIKDQFTEVSRLMFRNDFDYGETVGSDSGGENTIIKKCIISSNNSNFTSNIFDCTIENCLVINNRSTGGNRRAIQSSYSGLGQFCTLVLPDDIGGTSGPGADETSATNTIKNTASFGWTNAFDTGFSGSSDFNGSDDTTGPSANSVDNLTYADQFNNVNDATADFQVKAGSGLIGTAEDSSGIIEDILENVRPATNPTIGCHQFIVAAAPTPAFDVKGNLDAPLRNPFRNPFRRKFGR